MAAVLTQKLSEEEYTTSPDTTYFTCSIWTRFLWTTYIEAGVSIRAPNTI